MDSMREDFLRARGTHASITLLAAFFELPGWNLLRIEHDLLDLIPYDFQRARDSAGEGLLCSNRAKGNQREVSAYSTSPWPRVSFTDLETLYSHSLSTMTRAKIKTILELYPTVSGKSVLALQFVKTPQYSSRGHLS
jgi:hypothetical protein